MEQTGDDTLEIGEVSSLGPEGMLADVLVIDDNARSRSSIVRLLRRAGVLVVASASPIGATRLAVHTQVSVVVADLNMPAIRGTALVQLFRRNPRLRHVAIVLLSDGSAQELVTAATEVGADAAIAKFEMAETLVPAVYRLLRRSARPRQISGKFSLPPGMLNGEHKKVAG